MIMRDVPYVNMVDNNEVIVRKGHFLSVEVSSFGKKVTFSIIIPWRKKQSSMEPEKREVSITTPLLKVS